MMEDVQLQRRLHVETSVRPSAGSGGGDGRANATGPLGDQPARFPCSKMKLDNLFLQWLAAPDTQRLVLRLVEDAKAGRPLALPGSGGGGGAAAAAGAAGTASASPPAVGPLAAVVGPHGGVGSPLSPAATASALLFPGGGGGGGGSAAQLPLSPRKAAAAAAAAAGRASPPSPARTARAAAVVAAAAATPTTAAALAAAAAAAAVGEEDDASASASAIPPFYHPATRAAPPAVLAARAAALDALCAAHPGGLTVPAFKELVRDVFELPSVLAYPLFARLVNAGDAAVPCDTVRAWVAGRAVATAAEPAARLFDALRRDGAPAVTQDDLKAMMAGVLLSHPGLEFLQETPEFQDRYAETVIYRIFYAMDRSGLGRLTLADLRRGGLLDALAALDEEDDVNRVLQYFSYEHFYVIYCKFWELDTDHDFLLSKEDLLRYGNHCLTYRIVDRVFAQAGRPFASGVPGRMGYEDFVWFILSEEDKATDVALGYWFRCIDLDGDGVLSPQDMTHFYEEQLHRMECLAHEPVAWGDVLCQLHDMLAPAQEGAFTLRDLRRHRGLAGTLFNILFNLNKFVAFETRDPFLARAEREDAAAAAAGGGVGGGGGVGSGATNGASPVASAGGPGYVGPAGAGDWDRFARAEYVRLAMEEEGDGGGPGGGGPGDDDGPDGGPGGDAWDHAMAAPF